MVGCREARGLILSGGPSTCSEEADAWTIRLFRCHEFRQSLFTEVSMPEKKTLERARKDAQQGKAPSTQAGEFVREEMDHIREGKHGARSTKQAIAIGLSKARRAGVKLPPPSKGKASASTQSQAARDYAKGQTAPGKAPSAKRSRATLAALRREGTQAASPNSLSRHAHASARTRTAADRSKAARKAVRTRRAL
jgi:uncharacterized protein DUF6496